MSVKAMSAVWDMHMDDPAEKFVLLAYADHADHNGGSIYPAVSTIAEKTGYEARSVRRITRRLVKTGFLKPHGKGPKGTIRYRIDLTLGQVTESQPDPEGMPDLTLTTLTPDPGSANPSGTIIEPSIAPGGAGNFSPMDSSTTTIADSTKPESMAAPSVAHHPADVLTDIFNRATGFTGNQKLLRKAATMKGKKPLGPTEVSMASLYCELSGHELADASEARKQLDAAAAILQQPGGATETHVRTAWANSRTTATNKGHAVVSLWSLKDTARTIARNEKQGNTSVSPIFDATTPAYEWRQLVNGRALVIQGEPYVGEAARAKCVELGIVWRE